eukprot:316623-Pyramimonas_sp.AAC.1
MSREQCNITRPLRHGIAQVTLSKQRPYKHVRNGGPICGANYAVQYVGSANYVVQSTRCKPGAIYAVCCQVSRGAPVLSSVGLTSPWGPQNIGSIIPEGRRDEEQSQTLRSGPDTPCEQEAGLR